MNYSMRIKKGKSRINMKSEVRKRIYTALCGALLTVAMTVAMTVAAPTPVFAEIGWYAIDGDTVRTPEGQHVRLLGVDTAEKKCRCQEECVLAKQAKDHVQGYLDGARHVTLEPTKTDKYGRLLAHVYVDGIDLSKTLLDKGLARPYNGEKRKTWCE